MSTPTEMDLQPYEDALQRLADIPLGTAPIDREVRKLAEEGLLRPFATYDSALLYVRIKVVSAWWAARFSTSTDERRRRAMAILNADPNFGARLQVLQKSLDAFGTERPITTLDMHGFWDNEASDASDELWTCIVAARAAAERASNKLREVVRAYDRRGKPRALAGAFADGLARLWRDLTGNLPSVTHDAYSDDAGRTGPFVAFVEAASATLERQELAGNLGVAAEKAASRLRMQLAAEKTARRLPAQPRK